MQLLREKHRAMNKKTYYFIYIMTKTVRKEDEGASFLTFLCMRS